MFTGIVEEVGTVEAVREEGNGVVFTLAARSVVDGLGLGDSVAIDGACLTVTSLLGHAFTVQAVGTTLGRTTFGTFAPGRRVNLERALSLGQRLGGHIVQGHVDGVGVVERQGQVVDGVTYDVRVPAAVREISILHGSIALDGVALTVNALPGPDLVQIALVPYTRAHTTLGTLKVGDRVHVEGDVLGKYVRQLCRSET